MSNLERPRRIADLVLHHAGDDYLVHDQKHAKVHVLNTAAGLVLSLCDGEHSVPEIVDGIDQACTLKRNEAERDVTRILREFEKLYLLERT
ncbi:MAG: PqqD family protein [Candidatus Eremiobacteraeota bacterium]|nr:PqqD family protein [Candidatus Eremiobacteraeota bacterium]